MGHCQPLGSVSPPPPPPLPLARAPGARPAVRPGSPRLSPCPAVRSLGSLAVASVLRSSRGSSRARVRPVLRPLVWGAGARCRWGPAGRSAAGGRGVSLCAGPWVRSCGRSRARPGRGPRRGPWSCLARSGLAPVPSLPLAGSPAGGGRLRCARPRGVVAGSAGRAGSARAVLAAAGPWVSRLVVAASGSRGSRVRRRGRLRCVGLACPLLFGGPGVSCAGFRPGSAGGAAPVPPRRRVLPGPPLFAVPPASRFALAWPSLSGASSGAPPARAGSGPPSASAGRSWRPGRRRLGAGAARPLVCLLRRPPLLAAGARRGGSPPGGVAPVGPWVGLALAPACPAGPGSPRAGRLSSSSLGLRRLGRRLLASCSRSPACRVSGSFPGAVGWRGVACGGRLRAPPRSGAAPLVLAPRAGRSAAVRPGLRLRPLAARFAPPRGSGRPSWVFGRPRWPRGSPAVARSSAPGGRRRSRRRGGRRSSARGRRPGRASVWRGRPARWRGPCLRAPSVIPRAVAARPSACRRPGSAPFVPPSRWSARARLPGRVPRARRRAASRVFAASRPFGCRPARPFA